MPRADTITFTCSRLNELDNLSDAGFHIELADILTRLRDAHTTYQGPRALADANAALPFSIEGWQDEYEAPHYIVTHVAKSARAKLPAAFAEGVEIEFCRGGVSCYAASK